MNSNWQMRVPSISALLLVVIVNSNSTFAFEQTPQVGSASPASQEQCQLRAFTINRDELDDFTVAWREGVLPLRRKHGFTVPFSLAVPETNQFYCLLCYAGPEDFETKDKAYYASEERRKLSPDPRQFIARIERWFVVPVLPAR